jgi:hypothetical protein
MLTIRACGGIRKGAMRPVPDISDMRVGVRRRLSTEAREIGFPHGICYGNLMMRNNVRMHKLLKTSTYVRKYLTRNLVML